MASAVTSWETPLFSVNTSFHSQANSEYSINMDQTGKHEYISQWMRNFSTQVTGSADWTTNYGMFPVVDDNYNTLCSQRPYDFYSSQGDYSIGENNLVYTQLY